MKIQIRFSRSEWEGMAYVTLHGDLAKFQNLSIGKVEFGFNDSFLKLDNAPLKKFCGAILTSLIQDNENYIEIDPCLLSDLSAELGTSIDVSALQNS